MEDDRYIPTEAERKAFGRVKSGKSKIEHETKSNGHVLAKDSIIEKIKREVSKAYREESNADTFYAGGFYTSRLQSHLFNPEIRYREDQANELLDNIERIMVEYRDDDGFKRKVDSIVQTYRAINDRQTKASS